MSRVLFHKYEVLRTIGSGRTGTVYLVKDLHLNRLAAVKESTEEFLLAETELLKEAEHPGLPAIYDCFKEQGHTFLVMEYVEGMTLRKYLEKHGRVPERQAVKWAAELCRILGYLHSRQPAVIYRDLKPENIMIRQDGRLKLIDLGGTLQAACGREKEAWCAGTPGYAPPEQWKQTRGDKRWDIYGLGAVLHEMLTGVHPARNPYGRRPVREYDKALCALLDEIISRCTTENTKSAFSSMEQVEHALLDYPSQRRKYLLIHRIKRIALALMGGYAACCLILPLLRGVPENQFPFPYLIKPFIVLILFILISLIFTKRKRKRQFLRRQEKNIWLTEKKFSGLFIILLVVFGLASGTFKERISSGTAYAKEEDQTLWVEMRDSYERKLLLKYDAVYITNDKVRFELPAERLPTQELSVQIVAVGEDGEQYRSRIFHIKAEEMEAGSQ